jgi:ribokinase
MDTGGVLVIGSANMDLVVTTTKFPEPGETVFGKEFKKFPGGKGANQAVAAAKLGADTYFIGKFGDDVFCSELSENMKSDGVQIPVLLKDKKSSTGVAFITVNSEGQNEIVVISGSNMKLTPDDIEQHSELFDKCSVVLTQLEIPVETVMKAAALAKKKNLVFILNPAPARELPEELYSKIDYLIPNELELEFLSGEKVSDEESIKKAALSLITRGIRNVIVTMGSKGAMLVSSEGYRIYPSSKVEVVDTTAAGDSFNGTIAFSLAGGKNIDEAVRIANKAASISVTRMGAQSSMPYYQEIEELLKTA